MPPPPARVQLKVKDGTHRSRVVKPGDTVHILETIGEWKLDEISSFPPPHIVSIQRRGGGGKRIAQYDITVQFQTKDKRTHQAVFAPAQLQASKAAFLIGDEVVVQRSIKPVVVPVNTTGVIVGGDGDFYHVSFMLTGYEPPVTVSQDFVPADALTYSTKKRHPRGATRLEQSSASTVGVVRVQEAEKQQQADAEPQVEEAAEVADVEEPQEDAAADTPPLLAKAACHLQPHVFEKFKQWVRAAHNNRVENSAHLQGLLVQFLRQQLSAPTPQSTPNPAVLVALREMGATAQDIAELAESPGFHALTVKEAVKRYFAL